MPSGPDLENGHITGEYAQRHYPQAFGYGEGA